MNLNNFFNTNLGAVSSLVISAGEDCAALVNYIEDYYNYSLTSKYRKISYSADRYFDVQIILDEMSNVSLFGDVNFITVRFKTKPSVDQAKLIVQVIQASSHENVVLIICDKLDKKDLAAAWIATAEVLLLNGEISEAQLWAMHKLKSMNISLDDRSLDLLLSMNHGNYSQLNQDLERVSYLFQNTQTITYDDIALQLTDNAQYNVFALSDACLRGNSELALKIFENLCQDTEDTILVMWNISEDLRKLIQIKNQQRTNPNVVAILSKLRIWGNSIQSFQIANNRLNYVLLLSLFDDLAYIDSVIKGINSGNGILLLKQLVYKLSKG